MSGNYYSSSENFWSTEKTEHKRIDKGIRVLSSIDNKLQRAFEILERDDYGYMSRSSYSGITRRIQRCKEKNDKIWNYASSIHGILSDKESDFHRALSEAMEELSLLNINDYKVDNSLGITEYYSYTDYSNSYGYQGTSNVKVITGERLKTKVNFADIMSKTDMFGLNQQFEQYLKDEKKNIYKMSDKEIAELRTEFYTGVLTTSFDHKMESNLDGISEFLDYVPVVGGLKGIIEGCRGYTMTGEKLTDSERISVGVFGTLTLAVDVVTLGTLSATTTGAKALAKEVGKMAFADIMIAGYGTKYTSEVMLNLGMSPEAVMMTHMITSLAVGGYSSYKNYQSNLSDIMKNAGLENIDQAKDLMKYTGLSSKELAKQLENSSIESILGINKGFGGVGVLEDWAKHMSPEDAKKYLEWNDLVARGFSAEERYNLSKFGSIKTQLDYTTSTGLKLQGMQGQTSTIIGSYNTDMQYIVNELGNIKTLDFGARNGGFNVLNVPDELYNPETFWELYNKPWLEKAVNRGDSIVVATKPNVSNMYIPGTNKLTGFGNEIKFLENHGYYLDEKLMKMIKK